RAGRARRARAPHRRSGRRPCRHARAVGRRRPGGDRLRDDVRRQREQARRGARAVSLALELLALPFLACLVLAGIHAYLGLHVLARGVIFGDLALAQVAAPGTALAFLAGHPSRREAAYWSALAVTLGRAPLLAASPPRRAPV